FVMTLDSEIDLFIGNLVRALYRIKPHIVEFHNRQVRLGDVIDAKSLKHFQDKIVDSEIDGLLRTGRAKQIESLEDKLKIYRSQRLPTCGRLVELAERRNVFAHHNGRVSEQYLRAAKDYRFDLLPDMAVGKPLKMTNKYFEKACSIALQHCHATAYLY